MLQAVRQTVLTLASPIVPALGKIELPLPRLLGRDDALCFLRSMPDPGVILLSRKRAQLTNLLIPGYWKHVAMYVGNVRGIPMVVEAVWPRVQLVPVIRWFKGEDYVLAKEPLFATYAQMDRAAGKAISLLGLPYDTMLAFAKDLSANPAFYCAEVGGWTYAQVFREDGLDNPFITKETLGMLTYTAEDFDLATEKWGTLWASKTCF